MAVWWNVELPFLLCIITFVRVDFSDFNPHESGNKWHYYWARRRCCEGWWGCFVFSTRWSWSSCCRRTFPRRRMMMMAAMMTGLAVEFLVPHPRPWQWPGRQIVVRKSHRAGLDFALAPFLDQIIEFKKIESTVIAVAYFYCMDLLPKLISL